MSLKGIFASHAHSVARPLTGGWEGTLGQRFGEVLSCQGMAKAKS